LEKVKEFKKFKNNDMVGEDFYVKTEEISVQLSLMDEEILEVYVTDSSSDKMEINCNLI
jgi:hypothetical protein